MKNRWVGGLAVAVALTLAACAPPDQVVGASSGPSDAPAPQETPGGSTESTPTPKASSEPGRGGYDY